MHVWPRMRPKRSAQRSRPCRPSGSRAPMPVRSARSSKRGWATAVPGSRRLNVPERKAFQYTVLRVVPDVERGERINVGVILYSPERKFLGARVAVNAERVRAIAPGLDLEAVERHLERLVAIADGDPEAGPIARLPQSARFGALS